MSNSEKDELDMQKLPPGTTANTISAMSRFLKSLSRNELVRQAIKQIVENVNQQAVNKILLEENEKLKNQLKDKESTNETPA